MGTPRANRIPTQPSPEIESATMVASPTAAAPIAIQVRRSTCSPRNTSPASAVTSGARLIVIVVLATVVRVTDRMKAKNVSARQAAEMTPQGPTARI
jgi:hypothetical protein